MKGDMTLCSIDMYCCYKKHNHKDYEESVFKFQIKDKEYILSKGDYVEKYSYYNFRYDYINNLKYTQENGKLANCIVGSQVEPYCIQIFLQFFIQEMGIEHRFF